MKIQENQDSNSLENRILIKQVCDLDCSDLNGGLLSDTGLGLTKKVLRYSHFFLGTSSKGPATHERAHTNMAKEHAHMGKVYPHTHGKRI